MNRKKFEEIVGHIREIIKDTPYEGHCFAVGGSVRDLVMENEIKDIDIVVSLPNGGVEFADWMEINGHTEGKVVAYPTYGTAMFRMKEYPDYEIECVQTRKEQYKDRNSRNPETCYGTIEEDAFRRDLTINALYYDITSGTVLDPTGKGLDDIKDCVIRTTSSPEIVFDEDSLRMLRVCRFKCRFGWEIEDETLQGIIRNVDRLSIITKERIQDELNKMLLDDNCVIAVQLLIETGLMKYVIPELCETVGMGQNKYHCDDVFGHTLKVLENIVPVTRVADDKLELRMAALLHDIGKIRTRSVGVDGVVHFYGHEEEGAEMCGEILRRLKYSNKFIDYVSFLVRLHMRTKGWGDDCSGMKKKHLRRLQYECGTYARFCDLLKLINADNNAHAEWCCMPNQTTRILEWTNEYYADGEDMFGYKLPINGDDVMQVRKIGPGKGVKRYLDYALKWAINDSSLKKDDLLRRLKTLV